MDRELVKALVLPVVDEIAGHSSAAEDAPQSGGHVRCRRLAMKRLSLGDALFLHAETPETPMHVASVTIFRPATQGMISSLVSATRILPTRSPALVERSWGGVASAFFDGGVAGKEVKK